MVREGQGRGRARNEGEQPAQRWMEDGRGLRASRRRRRAHGRGRRMKIEPRGSFTGSTDVESQRERQREM